MNSKRHELELLFVAMFAAVPLYTGENISILSIALFHLLFAVVAFAVANDRPIEMPVTLLRLLALSYLLFFPVDAAVISRSLTAASGHLIFFIALLQALDVATAPKHGQRLLVILLIFTMSVATSTSIVIVGFVIVFAVMMFRQLMLLSHEQSSLDAERDPALDEPRRWKPAMLYLGPTILLATALFPLLPRLHNPLVRGVTGGLESTTTGLSESIDFSEARRITSDPTTVARVWMPPDAIAFFTPLRLKGAVYDAWRRGRWRQPAYVNVRHVADRGEINIAQPVGFSRDVSIQQNFVAGDRRLLVPVGTHSIVGLPEIIETRPTVYAVPPYARGSTTYTARLSRRTRPLAYVTPPMLDYPITPAIEELAKEIAGDYTTIDQAAQRIEQHLTSKFEYVPDPATLGKTMTVDEFLLVDRKGHCEYFAAGMVVLLRALEIRSRIVGGYYGGKLNPLTGYFTVSRSDAHAWVEVYDGSRWATYDPTPPNLRPGNQRQGLVRTYASAIADSVNYFWDRYVLTFGLADQMAMIIEMASRGIEAWRSARARARVVATELFSLATLYVLAALFALFLVSQWFVRSRRPLYTQLLERLARTGLPIGPSTAPLELVALLQRERPDLAHDAGEVVDAYLRERFSGRDLPPDRRASARAALKRVFRTI